MREVTKFSFRAEANPTWSFTPQFPHQYHLGHTQSRINNPIKALPKKKAQERLKAAQAPKEAPAAAPAAEVAPAAEAAAPAVEPAPVEAPKVEEKAPEAEAPKTN